MKIKFILEQLNITSKTATDWASFCREVCQDILIWRSSKIGGPGIVVEIDESKFGKRKYNRGKRVVGRWVFGGVERGTNNCFFAVVENRTSEVLLSVIEEHILPGTTVMSDCWSSYQCLSDEGFVHLTVNHSMHFVDPDTGAHTQSIEGTWSAIKRDLNGTNHVKGQFDSYMAAYMWKRKNSTAESRMESLLDMIKEVYPPRKSFKSANKKAILGQDTSNIGTDSSQSEQENINRPRKRSKPQRYDSSTEDDMDMPNGFVQNKKFRVPNPPSSREMLSSTSRIEDESQESLSVSLISSRNFPKPAPPTPQPVPPSPPEGNTVMTMFARVFKCLESIQNDLKSLKLEQAKMQYALSEVLNKNELIQGLFSPPDGIFLPAETETAAALKFPDAAKEDLADKFGRVLATAPDWDGGSRINKSQLTNWSTLDKN
ncbi:hypothetical protein AVEN_230867-1 [Araneus ventricosus]|uniref:ISXO2-like transposase domain-containing protein n=1 Tax=Araneus ventricosus TaxID=182803 RepID=A0A4Y2A2K8_ARAVE|nr:hypothetical protein AVEN_230867-1 [Araneus ventricosus]